MVADILLMYVPMFMFLISLILISYVMLYNRVESAKLCSHVHRAGILAGTRCVDPNGFIR